MEVGRTEKNRLEAEETREEAGSGNQAWVEKEQEKTGPNTEDRNQNVLRGEERDKEKLDCLEVLR